MKLDENKSYLISAAGVVYDWNQKHTLKNWQEAVGGWVEVAPLKVSHQISKKHTMLCNEEGLLAGLMPNILINTITEYNIVGDVLMVPHDALDSETDEEETGGV